LFFTARIRLFIPLDKGVAKAALYWAHRTSTQYDAPSKLARIRCSRVARMSPPLRASNEGSPRPRVARAQKIIRLQPLLCSVSTGD
jgi:hypothetical protein